MYRLVYVIVALTSLLGTSQAFVLDSSNMTLLGQIEQLTTRLEHLEHKGKLINIVLIFPGVLALIRLVLYNGGQSINKRSTSEKIYSLFINNLLFKSSVSVFYF